MKSFCWRIRPDVLTDGYQFVVLESWRSQFFDSSLEDEDCEFEDVGLFCGFWAFEVGLPSLASSGLVRLGLRCAPAPCQHLSSGWFFLPQVPHFGYVFFCVCLPCWASFLLSCRELLRLWSQHRCPTSLLAWCAWVEVCACPLPTSFFGMVCLATFCVGLPCWASFSFFFFSFSQSLTMWPFSLQ